VAMPTMPPPTMAISKVGGFMAAATSSKNSFATRQTQPIFARPLSRGSSLPRPSFPGAQEHVSWQKTARRSGSTDFRPGYFFASPGGAHGAFPPGHGGDRERRGGPAHQAAGWRLLERAARRFQQDARSLAKAGSCRALAQRRHRTRAGAPTRVRERLLSGPL